MINHWESLRMALQRILDSEGDGWMLSHYVCILGIEQVRNGAIRSSTWLAVPDHQPDYVIDGLLYAGLEMREAAEPEPDE